MSRCLRCLIVGVLAFSLAIDVATACGRRVWRSHHCPSRLVAPAQSLPMCRATPSIAWGGSVNAGGIACCGCEWPGAAWAVLDSCGQSTIWPCEEIPCGVVMAGPPSCAAVGDAPAGGEDVIVAEHPIATESIVTDGVAPTPAAPVEQSPEPLAAIPNLEPVEPASVTEATGDDDGPVPSESKQEKSADAEETTDEQPEADKAPEVPAPIDEPAPRRNVFEDEDEAGDEHAQDPREPEATDESSVEPPFTTDPVPAESADREPAPEPAIEDAPAVEESDIVPDSADQGRAEPLRRWIDDTASFAVLGRLLAVRDEAVEIRRADGCDILVPLERLSGLDRGYVAEARERMAAARSSRPDPLATADR